jgi:FixJ family two-component response regulator
MKPVIVYVDDQKENLFLLKSACPEDWIVHVFECPVVALKEIGNLKPWVILSDQKMPIMQGFQFLEICKAMMPASVRIIVTAHADESLLISSIRKAHITDFIKKPWDQEELITRISAAIGHFSSSEKAKRFENELIENKKENKSLNLKISSLKREIEIVKQREVSIRKDLVSWVPPFVVSSLENNVPMEKIKRNVASITFDIKGSAKLIEQVYNGKPLRNKIIQLFTESILRHGGRRESISGDSSYGHFGLMNHSHSPADSAISAALDFRMALSNLTKLIGASPNSLSVGIALHFATELPIHIHSTHFHGDNGEILSQRGFDTSSFSADLLHRIEKITHPLSGTNIILTKIFLESLKSSIPGVVSIGERRFNGHKDSVELFVIPSFEATATELNTIREETESPKVA